MTEAEQFLFFWKGWLSQWHPSPFMIDGIRYLCAEQWMMAEKGRLFGDYESVDKILNTASPRAQQALGRTVKNFHLDRWAEASREIVYWGNLAKFVQNADLHTKLEETAPATLVEASPYDSIWGIGLAADDPAAQDRKTWRGTNWLGEVLMRVRKDLRLPRAVAGHRIAKRWPYGTPPPAQGSFGF